MSEWFTFIVEFFAFFCYPSNMLSEPLAWMSYRICTYFKYLGCESQAVYCIVLQTYTIPWSWLPSSLIHNALRWGLNRYTLGKHDSARAPVWNIHLLFGRCILNIILRLPFVIAGPPENINNSNHPNNIHPPSNVKVPPKMICNIITKGGPAATS